MHEIKNNIMVPMISHIIIEKTNIAKGVGQTKLMRKCWDDEKQNAREYVKFLICWGGFGMSIVYIVYMLQT